MRTIEERWRASRVEGNNFDALRLVAAAAVMLSHGFEIVSGDPATEPLRRLTDGETSLGRIAVMTFFVLSGFLLARSWTAEPRLGAFLTKRALRIGPALAFAVLSFAFLLGPFLSSSPPGAYFAARETWSFLANLALHNGYDSLPGVFAEAPIAGVVNGPLWTLKFEVLCYLTLACLGATRLLGVRSCALLIAGCAVISATLGQTPQSGYVYYLVQYAALAPSFLAGVLFALVAARVRLSRLAAGLALAGLIVSVPAGLLAELFPLFGGYLILHAGLVRLGAVRRAGLFGDFSYGLYLWGWPAQQWIEGTGTDFGPLLNAFAALPVALAFAVLSWFLVERPALALKDRLTLGSPRKQRPAVQPTG
jgi:peptidoglycan/LPS O-acetylase OafA/YrhL